MSLRCVACNAAVEYGQELCSTCQQIVSELNKDLYEKQIQEMTHDENGEPIIP